MIFTIILSSTEYFSDINHKGYAFIDNVAQELNINPVSITDIFYTPTNKKEVYIKNKYLIDKIPYFTGSNKVTVNIKPYTLKKYIKCYKKFNGFKYIKQFPYVIKTYQIIFYIENIWLKDWINDGCLLNWKQ